MNPNSADFPLFIKRGCFAEVLLDLTVNMLLKLLKVTTNNTITEIFKTNVVEKLVLHYWVDPVLFLSRPFSEKSSKL
jgi:hypothetical protein